MPTSAQRTKFTHTAVSVSDSPTSVASANNNRNFLLLQNDSDADIYCFASTATGAIITASIAFFGVGFFNSKFWANGFWPMAGTSPPTLALHQGLLIRKGGPDVMLDYKFTSAAISCIAAAPGKNLLVTEGIQ